MSRMIVKQTYSECLCLDCREQCFNLDTLCFGNRNEKNGQMLYYCAIQFEIPFVAGSAVDIYDAVLYLPFERIRTINSLNHLSFSMAVFYEPISENRLNWSVYKMNTVQGSYFVNSQEIVNRNISVDITNLLIESVQNGRKYLGVVLSTTLPNTIFCFGRVNRTFLANIEIEWNWKTSSGEESEAAFLYLECLDRKLEIVQPNDKIFLTSTINVQAESCICENKDGGILIKRQGYYFVSWTLNLEGSEDFDEIQISFGNQQVNHISYAFMKLPWQITDQFILQVTEDSSKYYLYNSSMGAIQLGNQKQQASCVIYKVD